MTLKTLHDRDPYNYPAGHPFAQWLSPEEFYKPDYSPQVTLQASNWDAVGRELDGRCSDSWGVFQLPGGKVYAAEPGTGTGDALEALADATHDYPVLDEEDYSDRQYKAQWEEIKRFSEQDDEKWVGRIWTYLFETEQLDDITSTVVAEAEGARCGL